MSFSANLVFNCVNAEHVLLYTVGHSIPLTQPRNRISVFQFLQFSAFETIDFLYCPTVNWRMGWRLCIINGFLNHLNPKCVKPKLYKQQIVTTSEVTSDY